MHNKGGAPVAFVEYADVRCAAQALISLQGTYLLSSDRGGVRIEYARNKMAETGGSGSNNGGSPTSGSSSSSLMSGVGGGGQHEQTHKYNLHAEVEAAKMSNNANMAAAAAAAANSALSQAVQGAPLHALGLYGHHIWLGIITVIITSSFLPYHTWLLLVYYVASYYAKSATGQWSYNR